MKLNEFGTTTQTCIICGLPDARIQRWRDSGLPNLKKDDPNGEARTLPPGYYTLREGILYRVGMFHEGCVPK